MKNLIKTFAVLLTIAFFAVSCGDGKYYVKTDKAVYSPEETIKVEYKADAKWADNAWIGIIASETPHGKESVNDEADVSYQYLNNSKSGVLEFKAPKTAGNWDIRMNDTDDAATGLEVASVSITVQ